MSYLICCPSPCKCMPGGGKDCLQRCLHSICLSHDFCSLLAPVASLILCIAFSVCLSESVIKNQPKLSYKMKKRMLVYVTKKAQSKHSESCIVQRGLRLCPYLSALPISMHSLPFQDNKLILRKSQLWHSHRMVLQSPSFTVALL